MTEIQWYEYADAAQMAASLAERIGAWLASALDKQEAVTIALPGGRSPWPIYRQVALQPLAWRRITVIPTDDRLVPIDDPLSNFSQLRECLQATGARLQPLIVDASLDPRSSAHAADRLLADVPWPPELVWLGMGLDSHTASIFPGADLQRALDSANVQRTAGVLPDPLPAEAPVARVTLTRAAIVAAHRLILVISGAAKRGIIKRELSDGLASNSPIAQVLSAATRPVEIHWCPS